MKGKSKRLRGHPPASQDINPAHNLNLALGFLAITPFLEITPLGHAECH